MYLASSIGMQGFEETVMPTFTRHLVKQLIFSRRKEGQRRNLVKVALSQGKKRIDFLEDKKFHGVMASHGVRLEELHSIEDTMTSI